MVKQKWFQQAIDCVSCMCGALVRQQTQEAFLNICLTLIDNKRWEYKAPAHL